MDDSQTRILMKIHKPPGNTTDDLKSLGPIKQLSLYLICQKLILLLCILSISSKNVKLIPKPRNK